MPFNAGIKARVIGSISGEDCIQVLHFGVEVPWNVDTITVNDRLKELANAIKDCILTTLIPAVTSDYKFHRVEASAIWPNTSDPVANDNIVITAGTGGAQGGNVLAQLVNKKTGGGGRRGTGRNFWPPAGEGAATAGEWDAGQLLLLAAFCACMAGKFMQPNPTTDFVFGVYSGTKDSELGQDFSTSFRPCISLQPSPLIATMGTRKKGKGS